LGGPPEPGGPHLTRVAHPLQLCRKGWVIRALRANRLLSPAANLPSQSRPPTFSRARNGKGMRSHMPQCARTGRACARAYRNVPGMGRACVHAYRNVPGMGRACVHAYRNVPGTGRACVHAYRNVPGMGRAYVHAYRNVPGTGRACVHACRKKTDRKVLPPCRRPERSPKDEATDSIAFVHAHFFVCAFPPKKRMSSPKTT
jgi:hypothetical protein